MLKKSITYTNPFTDEEVTEDHWFHFSKADLVQMQAENSKEPEITDPVTGVVLDGYAAKLQRIINAEDTLAVLEVVKDVVRRSYLKRVGDKPVKSEAVWAEFEGSEAHSELLFELSTDAEKASEFMTGLMPQKLLAEARAQLEESAKANSETHPPGIVIPKPPEEPYILTENELRDMDRADLEAGLAAGKFKLS